MKKNQFRYLNNSNLITLYILLLIFTHGRISCKESSPLKELIKSSIVAISTLHTTNRQPDVKQYSRLSSRLYSNAEKIWWQSEKLSADYFL